MATTIRRRVTRPVRFGPVEVGGEAPVSIQSMSTVPAGREAEAAAELAALARAGCQIVRVAVKTASEIEPFGRICAASPVPVVADVHFDHRLAVAAAKNGAAGLRINPGNIGSQEKVSAVLDAAAAAGIPVRVGVNAGSLERDLGDLARSDPARAMVESARHRATAARSALERYEAGAYGRFRRCGQEISPERLEALQWIATRRLMDDGMTSGAAITAALERPASAGGIAFGAKPEQGARKFPIGGCVGGVAFEQRGVPVGEGRDHRRGKLLGLADQGGS